MLKKLVILMFLAFFALKHSCESCELNLDSLNAEIEKLERLILTQNYGYRAAFLRPFDVHNNRIWLNNTRDKVTPNYDCIAQALYAYNHFKKLGCEVKLQSGKDELAFWSKHFFISVFVEDKWRIVDLTPPFRTVAHKRPLRHKVEEDNLDVDKWSYYATGVGPSLHDYIFPYTYEIRRNKHYYSAAGFIGGPTDILEFERNLAGPVANRTVLHALIYNLYEFSQKYLDGKTEPNGSRETTFSEIATITVVANLELYLKWKDGKLLMQGDQFDPFTLASQRNEKIIYETFDELCEEKVIELMGLTDPFENSGKGYEMREAFLLLIHNLAISLPYEKLARRNFQEKN